MFIKEIINSRIQFNPHHLQRYLKFVASPFKTNVYTESHHILPRSLYPQLTSSKINIVSLPARAHYIAHKMLVKVFPNSMAMSFAWWYMTNRMGKQNIIVSSRDFQCSREQYINNHNSKRMDWDGREEWLRKKREAIQALPIWEQGASTESSIDVWSNADRIAKMLPRQCTLSQFCVNLGYKIPERKQIRTVKKIIGQINSGWQPLQDKKWTDRFIGFT